MSQKNEIAVFGGGCFWCTEAIFANLKGVTSVTSGYAGGHAENPTYDAVCSGTTGHAEVNKIECDGAFISYGTLLEVFFTLHDPTTMNQQGSDVGAQYRSVILFASKEQQHQAGSYMAELTADKVYSRPIVTELVSLANFFPAEEYYQGYYAKNASQPYCRLVISPKLAKLREKFGSKLKA